MNLLESYLLSNTQIDLLPPLYKYLQAAVIIAGIFVISKFFWMTIYEIKYYKGAGEDYIRYGKNYYKFKIYKYFNYLDKI